jgi:predicted DNA binding CopG/RHH family protein
MTKETIPKFKSEDEEREFWSTHDATKFIDLSQAQPARFPELKPSLKTISIRLPESLLESIKVIAHKKDVPYQSLMKMLLAEAVQRELETKF